MMPPIDDLSDDFVAAQLKKDANESYLKYSSIGIDAFLPQKRGSPALKPNTRFLRNIIKETDNHNAALRKSEAYRNLPGHSNDDLTKDRLRIQHSQRRSRSRDRIVRDHVDESSSRHQRRRRRRDSDADNSKPEARGQRSSRRDVVSSDRRHRYRLKRSISPQATIISRSTTHRLSRSRSPPQRSEDKGHSRELKSSGFSSRSHRKSHQDREPDAHSSAAEETREHSRRRSRKKRSSKHSPSRNNSRSHIDDYSKERSGAKSQHSHKLAKQSGRERTESDPLDDILGGATPPQQPIPRGRGANRSRSNIDSHFDPSYDPSTDVQPGSEEDDWDQALEAMHDRQRWRKLGATRLKDAGFSEKDIHKWERGGEQHEKDLRWEQSGEGREWDRGKVVTIDGHVETKPAWLT